MECIVRKIALFSHHPQCSRDCTNGIIAALSGYYDIEIFRVNDNFDTVLGSADIVAFPGGIGDSQSFEYLLGDKVEIIQDFVTNGGKYLGICMGAYWAGSHYFDLLDGVDAVQYIKRPNTDIARSYGTVADVTWNGKRDSMYFYDGCALVGNKRKYETIATYANGDAMAIKQGNVGIIGCHPESQEYWYDTWKYMLDYWHGGRHHVLLREFVDSL
jgi:putative intracellular protease/amidase